jgi:hypothetical protein
MTVEDRRNGDLLSADLYMYKIIKADRRRRRMSIM